MSEEPTDRQPSVLVLGRQLPLRSIVSAGWTEQRWPPIEDYRRVVIDLSALFGVDFDEAMSALTRLLPSPVRLVRHMFRQGTELVVVNFPELSNDRGGTRYLHPIPGRPLYTGEMGTTVASDDERLSLYLAHVPKWLWYHTGHVDWSHDAVDVVHAALAAAVDRVATRIEPVVATRTGETLGFYQSLTAIREEPYSTKTHEQTGRALFLPPPLTREPETALTALLRGLWGVAEQAAPPKWLADVRLPAAERSAAEIRVLRDERATIESALREKEAELEHDDRFAAMLFETGEDTLEPPVREALRLLGAEVEDPEQRGKRDGRVVAPDGHEYALEIKGRAGAAKKSDVQQADGWASAATAECERAHRALLVCNAHRDTPPEDRPPAFPANTIAFANFQRVALFTTWELYLELDRLQRGTFDSAEFWAEVDRRASGGNQ